MTIEPLSSVVKEGSNYTLHCNYTYNHPGDFKIRAVTVKWLRNTDPPSQRVDSWSTNPSERVPILTANGQGNGQNTMSSSFTGNTIFSGSDASLPAINSIHSLTIHSIDAEDEGEYVCQVQVTYSTAFAIADEFKYSPIADIQLQGE